MRTEAFSDLSVYLPWPSVLPAICQILSKMKVKPNWNSNSQACKILCHLWDRFKFALILMLRFCAMWHHGARLVTHNTTVNLVFIADLFLRCKKSSITASNGSLFSLRHLVRYFWWKSIFVILYGLSYIIMQNYLLLSWGKPSSEYSRECNSEAKGSGGMQVHTPFPSVMNSISFAVRNRQVRDPEFWTGQPRHAFTLKNAFSKLTRQPARCLSSHPLILPTIDIPLWWCPSHFCCAWYQERT